MSEFFRDPDMTLYQGDAASVLAELEPGSVDMCATSPPFFRLRDYGVEGQIGLEETPAQWVDRLVEVFREVKRVLADTGVLWVELGDSYSSGGGFAPDAPSNQARLRGEDVGLLGGANPENFMARVTGGRKPPPGYKPKELLGAPWLLAFGLQADGWYLRNEIIWHKPNPMPESVKDRVTRSHSTVFLLSKKRRYYWNADAIREEFVSVPQQRLTPTSEQPLGAARIKAGVQQGNVQGGTHVNRFEKPKEQLTLDGSNGEAPRGPDGRRKTTVTAGSNSAQHRDGERWPDPDGRNARSVWTITTVPTPFEHFATWPPELVRRMIDAGCPEGGTVLDPFAGSGTTLLVARAQERRSIGIELNPEYCELIRDRTGQQSLLA